MSLEISQETQALIAREARKEGVSVDTWLQRLVKEHETSAGPAPGQPDIPSIAHLQKTDPQEWARQFRAWADGHDPKIPVLSDEAMSRESIYPDLT